MYLHTVLVAHNGYRFDFPILLAETERRPEKLALSQLSSHRIHFSDTLGYLKQVGFTLLILIHKHVHILYFQAKKDGRCVLKSVGKFGLEDLFHHFFENETYPGIVCYNYYGTSKDVFNTLFVHLTHLSSSPSTG